MIMKPVSHQTDTIRASTYQLDWSNFRAAAATYGAAHRGHQNLAAWRRWHLAIPSPACEPVQAASRVL